MICNNECPLKYTNCKPISNIIASDNSSVVCVGLHTDIKEVKGDIYRHCFKSSTGANSMFDYDEYDLLSSISVMTEALLLNNFIKTE